MRARQEPVALPPQVRQQYRIERVPGDRGSRWWPISAPIEPGRKPFYSINGDRGTMTLIGPDHARYVGSDRSEVVLVRVEGPIVRGGCL